MYVGNVLNCFPQERTCTCSFDTTTRCRDLKSHFYAEAKDQHFDALPTLCTVFFDKLSISVDKHVGLAESVGLETV